MNDEERQQFYSMYSVLTILLQRNDKTGALVNAELSNHGVNLGRCYQLSQASQSCVEADAAKSVSCLWSILGYEKE